MEVTWVQACVDGFGVCAFRTKEPGVVRRGNEVEGCERCLDPPYDLPLLIRHMWE